MTTKIFNNIPDSQDECNEQQWPWKDPIHEDFHVAVYKDKYPVTEDHLLFVPKYNTISILLEAMRDAVEAGQQGVQDLNWDGFNVGINYGSTAGQTVAWPHVHMIPRRKGDMKDPTGGVRHVIPEKGNYKLETRAAEPGSTADVMRKAYELAKQQLNNYKDLDPYDETDRIYRIEDARD